MSTTLRGFVDQVANGAGFRQLLSDSHLSFQLQSNAFDFVWAIPTMLVRETPVPTFISRTLLAILFTVLAAQVALSENLLPDPGCELPASESPWSKFPIRGIAKGSVTQVQDGRSGSAQCLELTEAMDGWTQLSAAIPGGIQAGTDYELTAWLKGDRPLHAIALLVHDNTHWFPTDHATQGANVDQRWSKQTLKFRAGKTDPNARVGIRLFNEGKLWVDDLSFSLYQAPVKKLTPGNRIPNSSFEVGWLGWTGVAYVQKVEPSEDAPHGKQCLRFNVFNGGHISTSLIPVDEGQPHRLSLMAKANSPTKVRLTLESGYAPLTPVGPETTSNGPATVALTELLDLNQDWQPFQFTVDLPPVPNSSFYIKLTPTDSTTIWLDQMQLRSDTDSSEFSTRLPREGHIVFANPNAIAKRGEAITAKLVLWNEDRADRQSGTLRLIDIWDRTVLETKIDLYVPQGHSDHELKVTPPLNGVFRMTFHGDDQPSQLIAENVFAVLPNTDIKAPAQSAIGNHVDFAPPTKAALSGARWTKTWWLGWENLATSEGQWKYERKDMLKSWRQEGMEILAVLSGPPRYAQAIPDNAIPWGWYPPRDYAAMETYAYNAVTNYQHLVGAWEITNEPNSGLHKGPEPSFAAAYAKQWRALAQGARRADPEAFLVAGSFTLEDYPDDLLREVFAVDPELTKLCDAISYHNYSHSPETIERVTNRLRTLLKEHQLDIPIWDTEWSPVKTIMPFYQEQARNLSDSSATPLRAAAMLIQGHVARIGAGVQRSFVYNGYQATAINRYEFEMLVEMTGAPRSTLVAQAILAKMLDGCQFETRVMRDDAWIYRFKRHNGKQLLVAWANETLATPVSLSLPPGWQAFDLMGNRVQPTANLQLDNVPVYLLAP